MRKESLIIILLSVMIISCSDNDTNKDIKHEHLIKRVLLGSKESQEIAALILDNNIIVWDLWKPVSYENEIDWKVDPYNNKSWRLYFHSLRMVGFLARAYEFEQKPEYISKSLEILYSWNKHQADIENDVWTDHAAANRVLNLSHFYYVAKDVLSNKDKKAIIDILDFHGEWLYDDNNYAIGNHAIMVDRALMQLANVFKFEKSNLWYKKGLERTKKTFEAEITEEGVCTENSPGYHIYVMDLLIDFITMHENIDKRIDKKYYKDLDKMTDYLAYLIKPDGTLPTLGDTYYSIYPVNYSRKYKSDHLLFVTSKSEEGIMPPYTDRFYPKSGYAIFRDEWGNKQNFNKSNHLVFTNTNQNIVHKHPDYLSFELYANTEELIVDPGHTGYERDSVTQYLKSTIAHNSLTLDEINFNIYKIPIKKSAFITNYKSKENYALVEGNFKPNDSIIFTRKIIFLKPNAFLFVDNVDVLVDDNHENLNQTFNFGKNLKNLKIINNNRVTATFNENMLHFYQIESVNNTKIYDDENELRGLIADGAIKTRRGKQLVFEKKLTPKFKPLVTLLIVENNKTNNITREEIEVKTNTNSIFVGWKNEKIEIKI